MQVFNYCGFLKLVTYYRQLSSDINLNTIITNQLISVGFEPVFSHTEKSCIALALVLLNFFNKYQNKILKL